MKKLILCVVVLLLAGALFADRNAIEEAISAYEAVVVEAENVANRPLIATEDFSALEQKAEAVGPNVEALESEREWGIRDTITLADLNARFNQAMTAIAKKLIQY